METVSELARIDRELQVALTQLTATGVDATRVAPDGRAEVIGILAVFAGVFVTQGDIHPTMPDRNVNRLDGRPAANEINLQPCCSR